MIYGLSVTTLLLVITLVSGKLLGRELVTAGERRIVYLGALATGVVFYPLALGVGPFDPYALGFAGGRPLILLSILLAASALAIVFRQGFVLVVLLTAVLAFSLRLGASDNLWDYVLDPWIVLLAIPGVRVKAGLRSFDRAPNSGKSGSPG